MSNHVTPKTAHDLKHAGFKQPEQKPGQFWYLENRLYIIVAILTDTVGETAILYEVCQENRDPSPLPVRLPFSDVFVYAPTAPDILRELGAEWNLDYHFEPKSFSCFKIAIAECQVEADASFWNDNPAEACAPAWEAQNENP